MITADKLVEMKSEPHQIFSDGYSALILDIENFLVSKSDPEGRINSRYGDILDHKAKLMIAHQFYKVNHMSANELYKIFKLENLTEEETVLEEKYAKELLEFF